MEQKTNEQRSFTYTAPYSDTHVSADLSAMAMLFIELMCQQQEQNKSYGELIRTKDALAQFGFKNSQNAKLLGAMTGQMAEYKKATETLAFMEEVWQKFGTDAMVVRYDHFFQILEKYDMVCGSFDRYTGGIPQSALDTLTHLNGMWENKELNAAFATPFEWGHIFTISSEETGVNRLTNWLRMPIITTKEIRDKINSVSRIIGCISDNVPNMTALAGVLFIAAPAADMEPMEIDILFDLRDSDKVRSAREIAKLELGSDLWEYPYSSKSEIDEAENSAIRAEEERLQSIIEKSSAPRYCKCGFIKTQPLPERKLYDPFICSLTPHGVLIHAKWGAEAEDATIKRYEQLRDEIIGKGGQQ